MIILEFLDLSNLHSSAPLSCLLILLLQHLEPDDSLGQLSVIITKSEVIRGKVDDFVVLESSMEMPFCMGFRNTGRDVTYP
jgi:hypothetical protein